MGRINVRLDEDLIEKIDSQGEVRSEVVREALKQYLELSEVEESELSKVVEHIVEQKIHEDVYPRLGNIYDKLDEKAEDIEEQKTDLGIEVALDNEVFEFYNKYTNAFEIPMSVIVSDLLEEEAYKLSERLNSMSPRKPSWTLDTPKTEEESE